MKKVFAAALAAVLSMNTVCTAFAATKLEAPQVWWSEEWEAVPEWSRVEDAGGKYRVEVLRDNNVALSSTHSYNPASLREYYSFQSFRNQVDENGSYKFHVKALGDGVETEDSDWSEYSEEWNFIKPGISFGAPENPHWEGTYIVWDEPSDALSAEYSEYIAGYEIALYVDGECDWVLDNEEAPKMNAAEYMETEGAEYTFRISTISNTPSKIYHSEAVFGDTYDASEENAGVSGTIDGILNSDDPEAITTAPDKLAENRDKVQVAMQTEPEVVKKIAELEAAYAKENGIVTKIDASNDTGIDAGKIEIVGAGLNAEAPGSTVSFRVTKPEEEVMVDHTAYRNTVQVDFSLVGAAEELKVPVQITIPIPETINPKFFAVLHYHADGSYDAILPPDQLRLNGDGTATFTVTSFSTFVLAEIGAEPEVPVTPVATPSNATEFKNLVKSLPDAESLEDYEAAASGMAMLREALLNDKADAGDLDAAMVEKLDGLVQALAAFDDEFSMDVELDGELVDDVIGAHLLAYVMGGGDAESVFIGHKSLATASNATKLKFDLEGMLRMKDGSEKKLSSLKTPLILSIAAPASYDEVHKSSDKISGDGIKQGAVDYEDGIITVFTTKLGTVMVKGTSSSSSGSGSGSGGRSGGARSGIVKESDLPKSPIGGSWKLVDGKYSYYYSDGTRAENCWLEINSVWYFFGKDGIMATGWLKDNGNYFYLDPATGAMATGWKEIDGTWYYFNAIGNGFKGMMFAGTTVDGYVLDESGAWVR